MYCSPAFRCVQTCDAVLKGYAKRDEIKIKIEPGLFEWMVWYPDQLPSFMTPEEYSQAGYNVDLSYKPFVSADELLDTPESCEQFYLRSHFVTQGALAVHQSGNILFVGHAATLDVCSRVLIGRKPRGTGAEVIDVIKKVPYCALMAVAQDGDKWEIKDRPAFPVTHTNNQRFDSKIIDIP